MKGVQAVGHVRFEGGRHIIEVDGDVIQHAGLRAGSVVFVTIETIEVTA